METHLRKPFGKRQGHRHSANGSGIATLRLACASDRISRRACLRRLGEKGFLSQRTFAAANRSRSMAARLPCTLAAISRRLFASDPEEQPLDTQTPNSAGLSD